MGTLSLPRVPGVSLPRALCFSFRGHQIKWIPRFPWNPLQNEPTFCCGSSRKELSTSQNQNGQMFSDAHLFAPPTTRVVRNTVWICCPPPPPTTPRSPETEKQRRMTNNYGDSSSEEPLNFHGVPFGDKSDAIKRKNFEFGVSIFAGAWTAIPLVSDFSDNVCGKTIRAKPWV